MASLALLIAGAARAQVPFTVTLTNTTGASWDQGVLAVMPGGTALLPIGQSPTSGDPYDSYAYVHQSCDLGVEDDGDAALLIARWPSLTEGVDAFRVGPLGPGASQQVQLDALPGDAISFVARVTGTGDDGVILHPVGDPYDATVDLFDPLGQPIAALTFAIDGYDVNDLSPTGGGGACAATCPPSVPCYVSPGGNAGVGGAQPSPGGCDPIPYYPDGDGDGLGDDAGLTAACAPPAGAVFVGGDCDDADPAVGLPPTWYADADGDGAGDAAAPIAACTAPPGTVPTAGDCDDADPDNQVSCATCVDADGDGSFVGCDAYGRRAGPDCDDADPALHVGTVWYADVDDDGWGDGLAPIVQCDAPAASSLVPGDCDDDDATAFPGAPEVCDGDDEACDGLVDDADPDVDPTTAPTWYADIDGDGFGDPFAEVVSCGAPPGTSPLAGDCDDGAGDVFPGAPESCDGRDQDCDGTADEDAFDATIWYADADLDGAGDPWAPVLACAQPAGFVADGTDCDDTRDDVGPLAVEVCDGIDDDCDGEIDEDLALLTWYADADGDGWGDASAPIDDCGPPDGAVADPGDCDDADPDVNPDATELAGNAVDEDCDGVAAGADDTGLGPEPDGTREPPASPAPRATPPVEGCGCGHGRTGGGWGVLLLLAVLRRRTPR